MDPGGQHNYIASCLYAQKVPVDESTCWVTPIFLRTAQNPEWVRPLYVTTDPEFQQGEVSSRNMANSLQSTVAMASCCGDTQPGVKRFISCWLCQPLELPHPRASQHEIINFGFSFSSLRVLFNIHALEWYLIFFFFKYRYKLVEMAVHFCYRT